MAHRSQCSSAGDNPLDPNYLPPHYREEYRMAIDALVDSDLEGYYGFLQEADVVDFLSQTEIEYIKCLVQAPRQSAQPERRYMAEDADGSSDTYWPVHSDHDAPSLDLGWPQQFRFVGPTEVTTLVNPSDPETPSIKEQVRRMIKNAQQVIAVVMDMFTDVDIFADILNAATRGVAVYVLLDEQNAHHFVAMVNNCRVNLDEIKFMRVRTVTGSTYYCRKGKTFKGQMMDRFILVDCRAVLSGNYSFMWSFEKIHRCLAHLFLGQLVTTFDEEFRILFAHSEPLVVENILANMPQYSSEPESFYNTKKTHMFNRQYPPMGMEWPERTAEDHMNIGHKMLPLRSDSVHSATEVNPPVQRHMNMHAAPQYRGDHQFIEHGRQMRGPAEMAGFKRHSYGNIPDYDYPPPNHPTMRGNQYMEGQMPQGGHFAREPRVYQGPGLQSGYDMYGRFRGQGHHVDQFSGSGYPDEGGEAEPSGGYDHVQRYLQSHSPMEEGHGPRNPPMQLNLKRQSMGHSYTCQTSPTQPNLPEQKRFFGVNRKPQDVSQKQGLRDWRISSYLSAYDDAGELDLAELEGSKTCDEVPCFTQEVSCGPVHPENRPENREFNRENPTFVQIQNESIVPESSFSHPTNLSQLNMKTTPTSTSESSCTTEGDKAEEVQNKEPKEVNRIGEEFLKRKPSRPVQRSSRLRHSLIFSSNLELHSSDEMKDAAGEKDGDDASKLTERVSHMLDKRRTGSPFQPFQWSNFVKSATFDNTATESAQPEDEQNKMGENTDLDKVETSPNLRRNSLKGSLEEKDLPQTIVPEGKDQKHECPSNVLQKSSSFIDMNDPDCRLKYFKELAAKRKLAAAKASQSNPMKATQKFALPEKPSTNDSDKKPAPVFKTPETPLKSKNTTAPEIKETYKDTKCEESSKDILQRATDAEKIRLKKKLAEESGKPIEEARTSSTAKNQTSTVLNVFTQKPLSDEFLKPHTDSSSEPFSRNSEPLSTVHAILEANSSQNRVDSVAFNTASAESGTTQYHIPKETDHSHAVLTESCLAVKLPQTKNTSLLSTTPNEGRLSELSESQILRESLPNISTTCSDIVALDSNSTPNLAIVPTNSNHIDMGPSPSFSTAGISSSQHPTATNIDSSKSFSEITADFSGDSTKAQAKSSVAVKSPSQPHTLEEADFSKQHSTRESEPSQKSTSADIDTSQNPSTLKTNCFQQPTPLKDDISQHPTSTESETSQNVLNVKESDSFQQPPATESSPNSAGVKRTSSQHPTETKEDLSQSVDKSGTEISQHLTPAEMDCTGQSVSSVIESPHLQTTDSSQQPTATTTGSSHQSTTADTDSSQNIVASEIDPSQKPIPMERDTSQKSTALVVDAIQQHPIAKETYSSQKPVGIETHFASQPTKIETDPSQLHIPTMADSSQKPTAAERESSLQSTATESKSFQKPTAAETESSLQTSTTESNCLEKPIATEAKSSLQSTTTESDSSQKPTRTKAESSIQFTTTEANSSQKPTATEAKSSLQSTTTESDSSQKPTRTKAESSIQFTTTEANSSQKPTATEAKSSLQSTTTESDSSQKPTITESSIQFTATEADLSYKPTTVETESFLQSKATEADSSQKPTATEPDSSQNPKATETLPSLQSTSIEGDSSQKSTATETDFCQQSTANEADPSQKHDAKAIDSFQQSTAHGADSSQQPAPAEIDSWQKSTTSEADPSQKSLATAIDSVQHPNVSETDFSQSPALSELDPSQQLTPLEKDSSQHQTQLEAESSLPPAQSDAGFSQLPTSDTSQQHTPLEAESSQPPVQSEPDSSQHPTADSSQQHTTTKAEFSLPPCQSEADSAQQHTMLEAECPQPPVQPEPDFSQQPTPSEADSSSILNFPSSPLHHRQTLHPTSTDSFQQPVIVETHSTQELTVTESPKTPAKTGIDTSKHPIETEKESIQHITVTKTDCVNEKKDDNLTEDFSKVIPIPHVDISETDNRISQNTAIKGLCSPVEQSQSQTVTSFDSQVKLHHTEPPMVKDKESSAMTSPDSVGLSSTQPEGSPDPCSTSNEINSTQGITQLKSSISSTPSYPNDPELEKTDEYQQNGTTAEQLQRHDTPGIAEGPEIANKEVSIPINTNEDDRTKQTTSGVENPEEKSAEVSEKSDLTENPKLSMSPHQLSTANVISCSNLRDDTKVLLEQISAKNQSRSSQSKQNTAAPNEAKQGDVSSTDKLFPNYLGRSWTSKATQEERDMLLQKMEKMRKERKVYSRFEAS